MLKHAVSSTANVPTFRGFPLPHPTPLCRTGPARPAARSQHALPGRHPPHLARHAPRQWRQPHASALPLPHVARPRHAQGNGGHPRVVPRAGRRQARAIVIALRICCCNAAVCKADQRILCASSTARHQRRHIKLLLIQLRPCVSRRRHAPIAVHCSAGIGRTGTFCAIDITLQRLKQWGAHTAATLLAGTRACLSNRRPLGPSLASIFLLYCHMFCMI